MAGHGVAGVDQREALARDLLDGVPQEWIVRAAEHQCVGAGIEHRLQIGLQQFQHGGRVRVAAFDQGNEAVARLAQHLAIARHVAQQARELVAAQRAFGCQHADHPALRCGHRGLQARLDADHRHGEPLAQQVHGLRRGRVAGDHQRLAALADQPFAHAQRALGNEFGRFFPVRGMAGVRQVEEGFGRQFGADRAQDGESSEAGVEDSDRCLRACRHVRSA